MKKLLRGAILVALMLIMVVALTGCGNKLVATKTSTKNGAEMNEKHEFTFKGEKLDSIKMKYEFTDEASAAMMGELMKLVFQDTEIDGKEVILNLSAEDYISQLGDYEGEITKDSVKKLLEEGGYTVK